MTLDLDVTALAIPGSRGIIPSLEVTCPCQRNIKVSVKWCDIVQYQQLCGLCPHSEGRKSSKYQQKNYRDTSATGKGRI